MPYYLDINPSNPNGNQYVTIPPITVTGDFTIQIDCETYNTTTTGADGFLFSGETSSRFELYRDGTAQNYRPSLWYNSTKNFCSASNIWPYVSGSTANPRTITIQRVGDVVSSDFADTAGTNVNIASGNNIVISAIGARPNGTFTLGLRLYRLRIYQGSTLVRDYNAANTSSGVALVDEVSGQNGTIQNPPAGNAQWVFYSSGGTTQALTVPAAKQQDVATSVTIGTTQELTVPTAKQQDVAATVAIGASQVLTVPAAKQQDTVTTVTISANQVLSVPATKQQDVSAAVTVAQVAPGSQPITVPAAKQQDVAGVVTVGSSQLITAAGTKQQDKASAISIGQSQIVSVAAIKQQDKAASVTVGAIQTLAVQPVTQTDTAARVAVGTTQLVAVPSVQQIDRAAAITLTQQPPITQTIDVRTLRIELTTPRFSVARNTPVYTAQLTTPRYTVARA